MLHEVMCCMDRYTFSPRQDDTYDSVSTGWLTASVICYKSLAKMHFCAYSRVSMIGKLLIPVALQEMLSEAMNPKLWDQ